MSTRTASRRGSYAIEFGLLLPLLVLLVAGIVDLAQYLLLADGLTGAVAEGARAGARVEKESDAIGVAENIAELSWTNTSLPAEIEISATLTGSSPDRWLRVEGTVPCESWFGFLGLPETLSYTSTMRLVEQ